MFCFLIAEKKIAIFLLPDDDDVIDGATVETSTSTKTTDIDKLSAVAVTKLVPSGVTDGGHKAPLLIEAKIMSFKELDTVSELEPPSLGISIIGFITSWFPFLFLYLF